MLGLAAHMQFLRAGERIEPQGDPAVAVMIDGVGGKGLAAYPEIGRAVRQEFLGFRQPQANIAHGLMQVASQNTLLRMDPMSMLQ